MAFTGPIEDRIRIRELIETYALGVMEKNVEEWASVWAEDAYWALPEFPDLGGFDGKPAIAGWLASMEAYGLENRSRPMVYVATPGRIEVDGDRAKATVFTSEVFDDPQSGELVRARGRYDDELRKIDGQWVFTRREYRILHMA